MIKKLIKNVLILDLVQKNIISFLKVYTFTENIHTYTYTSWRYFTFTSRAKMTKDK